MDGRPAPRPDLAALRPYRSSETMGGRVLLHANENPYPLPAEVMDEILAATRDLELNRYPPPQPTEVIEELGGYCGVDPAWIWVGDGANEVLLQACLAYGGPGRTALMFEPTYAMHHRQAGAAGTRVEVVWRAEDFSIPLDDALAGIGRLAPEMVFVCTPNNPTGTVTSNDDLERIARSAPGLVVIDEAYHEFSGTTFVPLLDRHPNVVVVRSFSKAFRLAGVRFGYAVAHPDVLEPLGRVRMPYSMSAFTQVAALSVLRHRDLVLERVSDIVAERERLASSLAELEGAEVSGSGANFVLFRHPRAARLVAGLAERGIVVRDFTSLPGCEGCVRVTAGTPEENTEFLEALTELASAPYHR